MEKYLVNKPYYHRYYSFSLDPSIETKIELYLFCYRYSDDVKSFIKELVDSNGLDNLKMALAILENNYEIRNA